MSYRLDVGDTVVKAIKESVDAVDKKGIADVTVKITSSEFMGEVTTIEITTKRRPR